jgi:hypothetical protein
MDGGVANPLLSGIVMQFWCYATHSVLGLNEGIIDGNDLDIAVLDGVAEHDTANSAKAIDADLDGHCEDCFGLFVSRELEAERTRWRWPSTNFR